MALKLVVGEPGSGKSYWAVTELITQTLIHTRRPIYSNLPIDWEGFEKWLRSSGGHDIEAYKARVTLSHEKWPDPRISEAHDRNFWLHVAKGTVVILDEAADLFPVDDKGVIPGQLRTFINHHRHYNIDIYLFVQSFNDLPPVVRGKVAAIISTENCLGMPCFPGWQWMEWVIWWFPWFRAREYRVRQDGKDRRMEPLPSDSWNMFPSSKAFATYRSFDAARGLNIGEGATQEEVKTIQGYKTAEIKRRARRNLLVAVGVIGGAIFGIWRVSTTYWEGLNEFQKHPLSYNSGTAAAPGRIDPSPGLPSSPGAPGPTGTNQIKQAEGGTRVVFRGRRVTYYRTGSDESAGVRGPETARH